MLLFIEARKAWSKYIVATRSANTHLQMSINAIVELMFQQHQQLLKKSTCIDYNKVRDRREGRYKVNVLRKDCIGNKSKKS
jgi:hypothetical protein